MIKRIVEISSARTHLAVKYDQLIIKQEGTVKDSIPIEDMGILIIDHQGVTYTHSVFTKLLKNNAAIVLCAKDHHPTGLFLPIESNSIQTERYRHQINAKRPLKKRLWKQIIKAKIKHQAKNLGKKHKIYKGLMNLRKQVRSGDTSNIEAQASRKYWPNIFDLENFKRNRNGPYPNNLLNYGYMVMRAAIARSICSAGLLPSLGLHHHNRYNAFCLADDIMEPFRGFIEAEVKKIVKKQNHVEYLDQSTKAELLKILHREINISNFKGPLTVGLHRTSASLQRCFEGTQDRMDLPKLCS